MFLFCFGFHRRGLQWIVGDERGTHRLDFGDLNDGSLVSIPRCRLSKMIPARALHLFALLRWEEDGGGRRGRRGRRVKMGLTSFKRGVVKGRTGVMEAGDGWKRVEGLCIGG